jgi:hypothetical protein
MDGLAETQMKLQPKRMDVETVERADAETDETT